MANDITASFPEYFSRRMQRKMAKTARYRMIANFEETGTLKNGDTVHRPYRSELVVNDVGTGGSYSRQDISDTDEYMTVNKEKEVTFYLKDADSIQSNYQTANDYGDDAGVALSNKVDGDVLGEYDQATSVVANYEINASGSAKDGIGFTFTTSNVLKVFAKINEKLDNLDVPLENRWGIISPQFKSVLVQFLGGKDSPVGDTVGQNGYIGSYGGFKLYLSTALASSYRLELGTLPTDGDTVVINGVTFTFKDSIGTTAGYVHIGASTAAVALTNLVNSINAPGTTVTESATAGFVAVSAANQKKLKNVTATDGSTYLTLKVTGKSYIAVSETLTAAADIWTTTKQLQHNLFGQGTPVDVVIQKYPKLDIRPRDGYIGKDFVNWILYAIKTFKEGADCMVDVQLRADAF